MADQDTVDQENQACMPQPTSSIAPASENMTPADGAGVAPGAGDPANPMLVAVASPAPEVHDPVTEEEKKAGEQLDNGGKVLDLAGTLAKNAGAPMGKLAEEAGGKIGGLASLPGDIMATAGGITEIRKGDVVGGAIDTGIGAAGIIGDAASVGGMSPVADVANGVKGVLETGKGLGQLADAATADPLKPGESGVDRADETVNGIENVLKGVGDGSQAFGPTGQAVGKALNGGMALGNLVAPLVFGDMKESTGNMGQTADGEYHGTTGNGVIDFIAGVGKYSNGRLHDSSADPK